MDQFVAVIRNYVDVILELVVVTLVYGLVVVRFHQLIVLLAVDKPLLYFEKLQLIC